MRKGSLPLIKVGRRHLPREKWGEESSPRAENGVSSPQPAQPLQQQGESNCRCYWELPLAGLDCPFVTLTLALPSRIATTARLNLLFFESVWCYYCSQVTRHTLGATGLPTKGLGTQHNVLCCCLILHSAYHSRKLLMPFAFFLSLHKLGLKTAQCHALWLACFVGLPAALVAPSPLRHRSAPGDVGWHLG